MRRDDKMAEDDMGEVIIMSTVEQEIPMLVAGDRLTRDEFLRRWEAMPNVKLRRTHWRSRLHAVSVEPRSWRT